MTLFSGHPKVHFGTIVVRSWGGGGGGGRGGGVGGGCSVGPPGSLTKKNWRRKQKQKEGKEGATQAANDKCSCDLKANRLCTHHALRTTLTA